MKKHHERPTGTADFFQGDSLPATAAGRSFDDRYIVVRWKPAREG